MLMLAVATTVDLFHKIPHIPLLLLTLPRFNAASTFLTVNTSGGSLGHFIDILTVGPGCTPPHLQQNIATTSSRGETDTHPANDLRMTLNNNVLEGVAF